MKTRNLQIHVHFYARFEQKSGYLFPTTLFRNIGNKDILNGCT